MNAAGSRRCLRLRCGRALDDRRINAQRPRRVIAAQPADNDALAQSVSVQPTGGPAPPASIDKVIDMTATQHPANPFTRWTKTVISAVRHANDQLLAAGDAMARANRFPQPSPQGDLAQAKQAHPASSEKVPAGV